MELSSADCFLLGWAFMATILYVKTREELKFFKYRMGNTLQGIAEGKLKVIDHGDHCEIKEV